MSQIYTCQSKNLREVFQDRYTISSYQREYKWGKEQIRHLVSDFYLAFKGSGNKLGQKNYFLGTVATQNTKKQTLIIDGQQRLTTLSLLFIYLGTLTKKDVSQKILQEQIYSFKTGKQTLSVDIEDRNWLVHEIIDVVNTKNSNDKEVWKLLGKRVDKEKDISNRNLLSAFKLIEEEFEKLDLTKNHIEKFIQWVSYKVHLVVIQAGGNDSANVIFETMNDRGIGLTESELLKAYMISHLSSNSLVKEVDESWRSTTGMLHTRKNDKNDEKFFKAWFRAKYAETTLDYEEIGGKFHHWIRNRKPWGTNTAASVASFVKKDMRKFAQHYHFLQLASYPSNQGDPAYLGFEEVYFNKQTSFDLQYTCALAPIKVSDTLETAKTKLRLVTSALEIFVVRCMVNNESYAASSVKTKIFELILNIRDCSIPTLQEKLTDWLKDQELAGTLLDKIEYSTPKVKQARYLLSRITAWLDLQMDENKASFHEYMSTNYSLEHILPNTYDENSNTYSKFTDRHDYTDYRTRVSALLIVDENANKRLGPKPYEKKLLEYQHSNWLAQSLNKDAYQRSKKLRYIQKKYGKGFGPYDMFGKSQIDQRAKVFAKFAKAIWDPKQALKA